MNNDIKTLIKLLKKRNEIELANVLKDCDSYIDESNQFGSYLNSWLSKFVILAPADSFWEVDDIVESRKDILLAFIKLIYPDKAESPEITDVSVEILKEGETAITEKEINKKENEDIHVFISYSTKDKDIAHKVSSIFNEYKINYFLAHEDIEVTEEWSKVILQNLFTCNVFIPLLTINFKNSNWTSQEMGIILGKKEHTLIIPLKKDVDPFGFISHLQAGRIDDSDLEKKILKKICFRFPNQMFEKLLIYFGLSGSFRDSENRLNLMIDCLNRSLELTEINEILKIALTNDQIAYSFGIKNWIIEQIKNNKDLDKKVIIEYKKHDFYKEEL